MCANPDILADRVNKQARRQHTQPNIEFGFRLWAQDSRLFFEDSRLKQKILLRQPKNGRFEAKFTLPDWKLVPLVSRRY